jgi:hypothetical protein
MANLQKYFESYHAAIRTDYDTNRELAEKRDIVLDLVVAYLKDRGLPSFERLLQGSYRMKTGVLPIGDLTYDIDIGLCFDLPDNYTATEVRKWVHDAVRGHTDKLEEKGPCIRVHYKKGFSLDLVIYKRSTDALGRRRMQLGHKDRGWVDADPVALLKHFDDAVSRFEGSEDNATKTVQVRRLIRDLKRWSDEQIKANPDLKPSGIAFSLFCIRELSSAVYAFDGASDDSAALVQLINRIPSGGRLSVQKPTPEYEDVFGKLTDSGMTEFKEKIFKLRDAINDARDQADPVKACQKLREHFGKDFPVPSPKDTSRKTSSPAIITSSSAA